ncbi:MAG: hypothetical protein Kow0077_22000 [Anaerolineae bacterium]
MDRILLNYNFDPADADDRNWAAVFEARRRNAAFAFVFQQGDTIFALRDHLGTAPLYFRYTNAGVRFALTVSELIRNDEQPRDRVSPVGLKTLVGLSTPRLNPLIEGIDIVPPGAVLAFDTRTGHMRKVYQYLFNPRRSPVTVSMRALVAEYGRLFQQAMARLVARMDTDTVGLYLSGGADSGLIALYLQRAGVRVNAYTVAPWGKQSTDRPFAQQLAAIAGCASHHIVDLESEQYATLMARQSEVYRDPVGIMATLGITSLWLNTSISDERRICVGHMADTMFGTVPSQYLSLFASYLPHRFSKHKLPYEGDIPRSYAHFASRGLVTEGAPILHDMMYDPALTRLDQLVLTCTFYGTRGGEPFTLPAVVRGIPVDNPYYDMDLIEFAMGVPLRHRLKFRFGRYPLALERYVAQRFALQHLPPEIVLRSKSLIVSLRRDATAEKIRASLPSQVLGVPLRHDHCRFAAAIFDLWRQDYDLELPTGYYRDHAGQ